MRVFALLCSLLAGGCLGIPIHARTAAHELKPEHAAWKAEWVSIQADEKTTLRGLWIPNGGPPVLLLNGSGMGVASSSTVKFQKMLRDAGYSVLCCDYRGTGYSGGKWWRYRSRKLDDDAKAMWEWLVEQKGRPAGVVGVSIGALAATALLDHPDPPDAVVLDRPVDPKTVIRRWLGQYTKVGAFVSRLLVYAACDCDLDESLERAQADTLIVMPERDRLHPAADVERMLHHLGPPVRVKMVPGGHVSSHLVKPTLWRSLILDFLDARLRPGQPPLGGRILDPDPAIVTRFAIEDKALVLEVRPGEGRDRLPEEARFLVMGERLNGLVRVKPVHASMRIPLPRKARRRVSPLLAVRAVPESYRKGTGTGWLAGKHEPVLPEGP